MKSTFICGRTAQSRSASSRPLMCGITTSVIIRWIVVGVTLGDAQRIHAVPRFEHDVAVAPQDLARERSHGVFVLDQQHGFPPVRLDVAGRRCRPRAGAAGAPPAAGTP